MDGTAYIVVAILALLVIAVAIAFAGLKKPRHTSPLTGVALAFIVSAVLFAESRLVGYTLIGIGVVIAVVDGVARSRRTH